MPGVLDGAIAAARQSLIASRKREEADLAAETDAGHEDGRNALLPRIRALTSEVVLPHVHSRREMLLAIGSIWVGEEVWRRGRLPRIFIEYRSRIAAPEAPRAVLTIGAHPDGTVIITRQFESPLRHTETRLHRIDELTPETVAAEIDQFLSLAAIGRITG